MSSDQCLARPIARFPGIPAVPSKTPPTDSADLSKHLATAPFCRFQAAPWDGRRMVVACSPDHMRQLHDLAEARPYNDAELWAGKLLRALEDARPADQIEISVEELRHATGLTPEQLLAAMCWLERDDL
ncbi:hypothetical protein [Actinomadura sp. NEAU-AAG7]|uniref:hypothetical protein n=1 Tax=Actinomadura sp. NEAU-AAG7 TaxID=2839640 RepID=UPI001BE40E80|nr:hypothetical protein [Actinomadura sp. NEAU-AAG7]MBT2207718.1 hypothetical protein [Actinomadura sp. NEAU-AAG7]